MLENLIADAPFRGEVYVHFCEISGKSYVGQTVSGMIPRWKDHVKGSRHPKYVSYNFPFSRAIRKYGKDAFEHQVVAVAASKEELDNLEKCWIIFLNSRENGYNVTAGGEGSPGHIVSEESRAKMSAAKKGHKFGVGRVQSAETRSKIAAKHIGKCNLSPEGRMAIAEASRNRKHTEEAKAKISATHKGVTQSDESRAKISASHIAYWEQIPVDEREKYLGPLHSAETKAKLKAIRSTPEARAANSARAKAYWAAKKTAEAVQRG